MALRIAKRCFAGMVAAGVVGAVAAMVLAWWGDSCWEGCWHCFGSSRVAGLDGDVTQSKRAQGRGLDKMALLEAQVNASPDGMLVVDAHNRRILTNPRMLELFKVPKHVTNDPDDEALLKHVVGLTSNPDQFLQKVRYLYDHMNEKSVDEIELKDGRILDRYSSPVFGNAREYYGRIWILRDVTAQRRAEEESAKLSQVVEQTPTSVMITDLSGNIEYVNLAFTENYGYTAQEVKGKNPRMLKSGLMPPETYSGLWRELTAGREWYGELQNRRKNGEIVWQLVHISPLRNARGQITHYTAVKENITARKAMEDALRLAALTDKLTGLPNRTLFGDRLQQAILRSKRHKEYHFAVLFLDFDRFKTINDSLGHYVGDLLLKEIARRLSMTMRSNDSLSRAACDGVAARLGGDEFVVLLDSLQSPDDATRVAARLIVDLSRPYQIGQHEVCSTVSVGVVTSRSGEDSADEVLRDADTAMYEAKLAGKGRYVVFDASMHDRVQNRLDLENDLRSAIGTDQLFLMYQPLVCLRTGQIDGFEALRPLETPETGNPFARRIYSDRGGHRFDTRPRGVGLARSLCTVRPLGEFHRRCRSGQHPRESLPPPTGAGGPARNAEANPVGNWNGAPVPAPGSDRSRLDEGCHRRRPHVAGDPPNRRQIGRGRLRNRVFVACLSSPVSD